MPSILKIRVVKARNLQISTDLKVPISYYSALKLIESAELLEESSGSPDSTSIQSGSIGLVSSESESEISAEKRYTEKSFFNRRAAMRMDRATSPSNFTFRTKSVACSDGAPKWDEDFRLEVTDDAQLQDSPLQLHLYREPSTWIGSLTVDLNPLLARDSPYGICGWFPLLSDEFDNTEIFLQAKIQFFGDSNPFKESSAGVQFFCTSEIPSCIKHLAMIGLVEDLLTEYLPENFSPTSLPSHFEAKLVGQLRRQIGKKVLEMGGSTVLSYQQSIEWEPAAKCVTVRGLGTAVKILQRINQQIYGVSPNQEAPFEGHSTNSSSSSSSRDSSSSSSSSSSSDSDDELNKAALIEETIKELPAKASTIDLVTISDFPSGVIESIGGIVSARAVKMSPAHEQNYKHNRHHRVFYSQMRAIGDFREQWQDEVREEIRAHAKTLACNAVIGYTENVTILDDLYILSASGTAVKAAFSSLLPPTDEEDANSNPTAVIAETENDGDDERFNQDRRRNRRRRKRTSLKKKQMLRRRKKSLKGSEALKCSACHLPYRRAHAPFTAAFQTCQLCHSRFVPEFLFGTCSVPAELEVIQGIGGLIEAYVCKPLPQNKSGNRSVVTATAISSALPFVEYDLHRQLLYKLRISGLNAVFGLRYRLAYTSEMIVAVATGTGLFLAALPRPEPIRISRNLRVKDDEDVQMATIQSEIIKRSHDNRDLIEETLLKKHPKLALNISSSSDSDFSSSDESTTSGGSIGTSSSSSDLSSDDSSSSSSSSSSDSDIDINDALAVIQIDDDADEDIMAVLLDPKDQNLPLSLLSRGNLDRFIFDNPCKVNHVVEINNIVIESMAHHPNLQMAAIFRDLYKKLKEKNPIGTMTCIDHQFISDDSCLKIVTTAIIYEPKNESLIDERIQILSLESVSQNISDSDSDSENAVLLPESFENVLVTASSRIPSAILINDYGRVSLNTSTQSKSDDLNPQILMLIDKVIVGMKAFSLAIGGNGLCAVRIDQGSTIITSLNDKRIRVSLSADVILYQ